MEGAGWHYSHLEGKPVYGYQILGSNIRIGNISLCYNLRRCCKENGAKIDMAVQFIVELPETDTHIIFQMDSWYTCQAVWNKAVENTLSGTIKANQILYPDSKKISASDSMSAVSQTASTAL